MLKKLAIIGLILFDITTVFYLISPSPQPPDLTNSVKSLEPGDTVQIPNVAAFYTNLSRTEVINFYKANYSGPFRIILNHPPEKSREIIKDTIQSYYFEEFVLPFKESLYINGFEWENDVFTKPSQRAANKLIYNNQSYSSKVTIRWFPVPVSHRLVSFFITQFSMILIILIYRRLLVKK
ncbi:MAG: hypothetical protein WC686_05400 [Candidatus Shapirobacteria bacterium]|jgi:hypothetical protein